MKKGFINEAARLQELAGIATTNQSSADYQYLVDLLLNAKPAYEVSYDDINNVVKIGGVGYDKGNLVNQFNAQPGESSKIKSNFYYANKHPEETRDQVESISNGEIEVRIGKGYGNVPIVFYKLK